MALGLAAEEPALSSQEDISHPARERSGPQAIIRQFLAATFPYAARWLY